MMSTRGASTTALIIVMILSMLDGPCTSRRRRTSVVVVPEIHYYCTAEQPLFGDLNCETACWYLSSLSSIGSGTASPPAAVTTLLPNKSHYGSSSLLIPRIQDIQAYGLSFNSALLSGTIGGNASRFVREPAHFMFASFSDIGNISHYFLASAGNAGCLNISPFFETSLNISHTYNSMRGSYLSRKMLYIPCPSPRYRRRNSLSSYRSGTNKLGADDDSTSKENLPPPRRRALDDDRKQQHVHHVLATKQGARAIFVGLALLLGLVCTIAAAIIMLWCRRSKKLEGESPVVLTTDLSPFLGPRRYSRRELATATHEFAEENKIGQGGFGPVYRAYLSDQNCHVAIKVLSQGSSAAAQQGRREFEAEVKVMTRLRHRNIVKLLGWCDGPRDLLLVYEFMPNGSLDKHLYHPRRLLTWPQRHRIALDVGFGILYLHTGCEQCVVHGDIKPANIMLDQSCNAKLGDFGLARLLDHGADSPPTTQVVAGTIGYIDPELVSCRRPSAHSDVYSFGVVLLEIACGKRPTTPAAVQSNNQASAAHLLLHWVRGMYVRDTILEAADHRLNGEFDERQMRRMLAAGLWCAHRDPSQRPSITQAMDALLREDDAELHVHLTGILTSASNLSLEEGITSCSRDLTEDSPGAAGEDAASAETAYYTSKDSARLIICS